MDKSLREHIIALVKSEVVPVVGCTEPIAVALCVAKATEKLGVCPEKIDVKLSANILKNAMGVGIPGTGMIGLPIAIALGALMLSHLTAIYIKQSLGLLSALCGCVVASTGSSCGITYLMGGTYEQVTYAVKNMVANLTGMICDGAKPSCALKMASGVNTAVLYAMLAVQDNCVSSCGGIIDDDVDRSIHNLTTIGKEAMNETDMCVLDIMTGRG